MGREHQDAVRARIEDAAGPGMARNENGPSMQRTVVQLQATAGNAAVTALLGRLSVQRRDAAPASPAGMAEQQGSAANPVFGAMWDRSVVDPMEKAMDATNQARPDYKTARDVSMGVQPTLTTAKAALPAGDPKVDKVALLAEQIAHADTALEPLVGSGISYDFPDWFGGLKHEAGAVGEALGGSRMTHGRVGGATLPMQHANENAEE